MICGEDLVTPLACTYLGVFVLVFGTWLVRVSRLHYWRAGGWSATYARVIPLWSAPAVALASLAFATVLFADWYTSCVPAIEPSPALLTAGLTSMLAGIVAIARLVGNRVRLHRTRTDHVPELPGLPPVMEAEARESAVAAESWKVPKTVRMIFLEYGATAVVALVLALVAISI